MSTATPPPMPSYGPPQPPKKNRTNAIIIGGAAVAVAAIVTVGVAVSSSGGSTDEKAEPAAITASATPSPSKDIAQKFTDWNDSGGGETLQTILDDLSAVEEASDPIDLDALRDACASLTADVETAQVGDPLPDEDTNTSWNLALDHLAKSATACTTGAVSEDQASFDLMASEMDIGIKHLNAVNEHLDEALQE